MSSFVFPSLFPLPVSLLSLFCLSVLRLSVCLFSSVFLQIEGVLFRKTLGHRFYIYDPPLILCLVYLSTHPSKDHKF